MKTLPFRVASLQPRIVTTEAGSWRMGKTTSERGYDSAWQRARVEHLKLFPYCKKCAEQGVTKLGDTVDHRVPHRGDQKLFWDRSNWDTICRSHHSRDKQRAEQ